MDEQPKVGPTVLGKLVLFLFVLACIAGAAYYFRNLIAPSGRVATGPVNMDEFKKVEAPDAKGITTVNEYNYVPGEKLPPVKGVSPTSGATDKVVNFPINVWIGWLPIVAANGGFSPEPRLVFSRSTASRSNLKLIDDPVVARDAFAAGESHVLWGTLDMMVLFAPELMKDSRSAPRIFQQVDWSSRRRRHRRARRIESVADLKGKTIVYAQNSPSQYFINNLLLNAGVQPVGRQAQVHRHRVRGGRRVRRRQVDRRLRLVGPRHLQHPREGEGHARPHHHRRGQQADRRRVGRARRLRQGPPRTCQGPGRRHLRGHGPAQGRDPAREAYAVDGRGLRHAGRRGARRWRNDAHSTNFAENKAVLPERQRPGQLRAHLEERHLRLPRAGPASTRRCASTK